MGAVPGQMYLTVSGFSKKWRHETIDLSAYAGQSQVQPASRARARRLLHVQQPLIDTGRPMPPQRSVQAGDLDAGAGPRDPVGPHHRLLDRVVGYVRERRTMQRRIIRQSTPGPHPCRVLGASIGIGVEVDRGQNMPHLDRSVRQQTLRHRMHLIGAAGQLRERLGIRDPVRHRCRVLEPCARRLERRDHREDRLALLEGLDAAGRERARVVDAVDGERDRLQRIAGPQKVAVQRVRQTFFGHRALRRDHGLSEHLPAEHTPAGHRFGLPDEDVLGRPCLAALERQHVQKTVHRIVGAEGGNGCLSHEYSPAASGRRRLDLTGAPPP